MKLSCFEELEIWKESREVALKVRHLTKKDAFSKDFKFVSQINGSAGSVMDNIAEGFDRGGNKEFIQFLYIAKGSNAELRSQLYRAKDVDLINNEEFLEILELTNSVRYKIQKLVEHLKASEHKGIKFK